jgi:hypothetical protein
MDNELRAMRLRLELPMKEMVDVVREIFPKYDKPTQCKCENSDAYGVVLRPEAMQALRERFEPEKPTEAQRAEKRDKHKLTCRISCRLEAEAYEALQQKLTADGYATMQELVTELVRRYIGKDDVADV